jgi:hypothetical protein
MTLIPAKSKRHSYRSGRFPSPTERRISEFFCGDASHLPRCCLSCAAARMKRTQAIFGHSVLGTSASRRIVRRKFARTCGRPPADGTRTTTRARKCDNLLSQLYETATKPDQFVRCSLSHSSLRLLSSAPMYVSMQRNSARAPASSWCPPRWLPPYSLVAVYRALRMSSSPLCRPSPSPSRAIRYNSLVTPFGLSPAAATVVMQRTANLKHNVWPRRLSTATPLERAVAATGAGVVVVAAAAVAVAKEEYKNRLPHCMLSLLPMTLSSGLANWCATFKRRFRCDLNIDWNCTCWTVCGSWQLRGRQSPVAAVA